MTEIIRIVIFDSTINSLRPLTDCLEFVGSLRAYCFIYFSHSQPQLPTFRDTIPVHRKFCSILMLCLLSSLLISISNWRVKLHIEVMTKWLLFVYIDDKNRKKNLITCASLKFWFYKLLKISLESFNKHILSICFKILQSILTKL